MRAGVLTPRGRERFWENGTSSLQSCLGAFQGQGSGRRPTGTAGRRRMNDVRLYWSRGQPASGSNFLICIRKGAAVKTPALLYFR